MVVVVVGGPWRPRDTTKASSCAQILVPCCKSSTSNAARTPKAIYACLGKNVKRDKVKAWGNHGKFIILVKSKTGKYSGRAIYMSESYFFSKIVIISYDLLNSYIKLGNTSRAGGETTTNYKHMTFVRNA